MAWLESNTRAALRQVDNFLARIGSVAVGRVPPAIVASLAGGTRSTPAAMPLTVIPAKAGIQRHIQCFWIPAFAGMTKPAMLQDRSPD